MPSDPSCPDEQFIRDFTSQQSRLYGLILSMLPDPELARDVLQETNVVIWRKRSDFEPGTNFGAWTARIACLQVAAFRTSRRRDRHVFDDELIAVLSTEAVDEFANSDDRAMALDACYEKLSPQERELLRQRYSKGGTVKEAAAIVGKSPATTRVLLFRLRHILLDCIQRRLLNNPGAV